MNMEIHVNKWNWNASIRTSTIIFVRTCGCFWLFCMKKCSYFVAVYVNFMACATNANTRTAIAAAAAAAASIFTPYSPLYSNVFDLCLLHPLYLCRFILHCIRLTTLYILWVWHIDLSCLSRFNCIRICIVGRECVTRSIAASLFSHLLLHHFYGQPNYAVSIQKKNSQILFTLHNLNLLTWISRRHEYQGRMDVSNVDWFVLWVCIRSKLWLMAAVRLSKFILLECLWFQSDLIVYNDHFVRETLSTFIACWSFRSSCKS